MNQEQLYSLLTDPVVAGFANGQPIEHFDIIQSKWLRLKDIDLDAYMESPSFYRVRPETKYRPLTHAEAAGLMASGILLTNRGTKKKASIDVVRVDGVSVGGHSVTYQSLMERYTLPDGSPCGVLVNE